LGNVTPNVNALISDTFANDTFGVLVDAAYSMSRTRANHLNIQGWQGTAVDPCQRAGGPACAKDAGGNDVLTADSRPAWYIQDYGVYQETTQDTRLNGRAVLQWRPSDALTLTIDDNFSRDTLHAIQYGYSVWFNSASLRNIVQNSNGTITSFIQPNTPTDFQSQINGSVLQNNDTGVNVQWDASDRLAINLDYDHSQAWLNPGGKLSSIDADVGYGPSTIGGTNGNNIGITLPQGHTLPYPTSYGPNGDTTAFLNNGLIGSHVLPLSSTGRFNRIAQVKAEAVWTESDALKITAGYQYVGDHDNSHLRSDFPNSQWQAYAGYGPASNNIGTHGVALPQSLFTSSVSTADFITGYGGANNLPPRIQAFDAYAVLNYLQGLGNPQNTVIPGFNVGCCTPAFDGIYRMVDVATANTQVIENTHAGYLHLQSQVGLGGMPLKINIGLRDEYTDVTTIGIGQQPISLAVQPSDHTAFQVSFAPPPVVITGHNDYQFLLPDLDLNLGVTDSLQIRFDASRTLTRPPLDQITPVLTVGSTQRVGSLVATGGNPHLMPYLSDNVDLSAEWYYQPNSYLSLDVFNKNVTNFIVQGSTQQAINNVLDPTTGRTAIFTVSTNVNGPVANVYGVELAVQHILGDSGFGFQANATLVGTDKPYNPHDLTVNDFAVTGLADSANLVLFYDRDGFMARIAANWRDNYLDHFGQVQNTSKFGSEPTFVNATTQVDFSTSYAVNRELSIYFSAQNLNNATFTTHGRFSEQILDLVDYGRRFTLGFHFKY
jgi:TonB-dependent receptor